jgi:hypothetical protein
VAGFQISPDSARVVYLADQDVDEVFELYSVPVAGPASEGVKLNGTLVDKGDVSDVFEISPNSKRVVYFADQEADEQFRLYGVPIAGPASAGVRLSEGPWDERVVSGDSKWVVYRAGPDPWELYSVPIEGPASASVKMNGPMVAGGGVLEYEFGVSPDGSRVVYLANQQTVSAVELYSVPIEGPSSAGVKLNGPLSVGGNVSGYAISPDGSRVAYGANQDSVSVIELYSVPIEGPSSAGVKLNGPLPTGGNVETARFSVDGAWVVYEADQLVDGLYQLFRAPATGPAGSDEMIWARDVHGLLVWQTEDSEWLVIWGPWPGVDTVYRLWVAPLAGTPDPSGAELVPADELVPGGQVVWFGVASSNLWVVYVADQETDGKHELYRVQLPGLVFTDGFESGDTGSWTAAVP